MDEIVLPYEPKIIVYYCGSNDTNAGEKADAISGRFRECVARVHAKLPATRIFFVSINRAPQKRDRWDIVDEANRQLVGEPVAQQDGGDVRDQRTGRDPTMAGVRSTAGMHSYVHLHIAVRSRPRRQHVVTVHDQWRYETLARRACEALGKNGFDAQYAATSADALERVAGALEALLNAGVTIIEAWEIAARASGCFAIRRHISQWKQKLVDGHVPSEMVNASSLFPELFANQYAAGELSGTLDDSLPRVGRYYQEEGSRKLKAFAIWMPMLFYLVIVLLLRGRLLLSTWISSAGFQRFLVGEPRWKFPHEEGLPRDSARSGRAFR